MGIEWVCGHQVAQQVLAIGREALVDSAHFVIRHVPDFRVWVLPHGHGSQAFRFQRGVRRPAFCHRRQSREFHGEFAKLPRRIHHLGFCQ